MYKENVVLSFPNDKLWVQEFGNEVILNIETVGKNAIWEDIISIVMNVKIKALQMMAVLVTVAIIIHKFGMIGKINIIAKIMRGKMMKFYKVRQAKCDFCKENKDVVTQADDIYICSDCANKILNHCIINEKAVENESK